MVQEAPFFIHQFELGPWDNFIYFIVDRDTLEAAVVDPAWHAPTIMKEAESLGVRIRHVLCTHSHFDHVNRVEAILAETDAEVHMLKEEVDFSGFGCENLSVRRGGDRVRIGSALEVQFLHTPGHTPGSCSYHLGSELITGDTLFVNGCGRCDFVGGDPEMMYETLRKLVRDLPSDTRMYPGHHYGPTRSDTLGNQERNNPFLLCGSVMDFVTHRMEGKVPNTELPPDPGWKPTESDEEEKSGSS